LLEADICYKHIRDKRKETTLLDVVFSERGQPVSVAEQLSMLHEVYSRIVHAGDSSAQARDAKSIMNNWCMSIFSTPACPINTVAGLAMALKQYADVKKTMISGASGGQKMKADGTVAKQLTREKLEFFFQLV